MVYSRRMSVLNVPLEGLRRAAVAVDAVADSASRLVPLRAPSDVGHSGVNDAAASFVAALGLSWSERIRTGEEIASLLRQVAEIFTETEQNAVDTARRLQDELDRLRAF